MPGFNLDDYEPVADRIERFWKDHPGGRIITELVHRDEKSFIVKASVTRSWQTMEGEIGRYDAIDATGYAEEIIGSSNVNRTSALENCETSAIGRALANLGYAVKNRASREEMVKAQGEPRPRSGPRKTVPSDSPVTAPPSDGNGADGEAVTKLKRSLLARTGGDKAEAKRLWDGTLEMFGYSPTDEIPDDMVAALGSAVEALAIKGEE